MASPSKRLFFGLRVRQLQRQCDANEFASASLATLRQYVELLESYFVNFTSEHQALASDLEEEDVAAAQDAILVDIESMYVRARAYLMTRITELELPAIELQRAAPAPLVIDLGTFGGEAAAWRRFYDRFVQNVHSNARFSPAAKFQYLRDALTGRAANVIRAYANNSENYARAWQILCDYYNDRCAQVHEYLGELFSMPRMRQATGAGMRQNKSASTRNLDVPARAGSSH